MGHPGRKGYPFYKRPGLFIYRRMPDRLRRRMHSRVERYIRWKPDPARRQTAGEQVYDRCRSFLVEELTLLFWGLILLLILIPTCIFLSLFSSGEIRLSRNPFGKGDRDQELVLSTGKEKRSVLVTIGEQELTSKEANALYDAFFKDLEEHLCGKNPSLQAVSQSLCFDETLAAYPFDIEYEPDDLALIDLSGEPGEDAGKLEEGQKKKTSVKVTASYRNLQRSRDYAITLVTPAKKKLSIYSRVLRRLTDMEEGSRKKTELILPGQMDQVEIRLPGSRSRYYALILLAVVLPAGLIYHKYYQIKDEDRQKRREEEEDFPLIVHLLTLYMRAGLSFGSAIHRICRHDAASDDKAGRYAYLELAIVDRQLAMGVSQREACMNWGRRSRSLTYQRLTSALDQILVKGSREGDRIMERLENEAFELRIDRARKEGKTAETRLLFPMMVLLCLAMILVLFPAVARFQGF